MFAVLLAAPLAIPIQTTRDAAFRVWKGASGPRSEVRIARPTLTWEVWTDHPGRRVADVLMSIDSRPVPAKYDIPRRAVLYTPQADLAPGRYRIECRVTFDNGSYLNEKWDTHVGAAPLSALPAPDAAQKEALAAVNRLRSRLRLAPMEMDDRLNLAARLHTEYLVLNKTHGHHQEPTAPGYVGATSVLRLDSCGYVGGSWEGVDVGSRSATEGVRNLFDAPYHRLPFLQPGPILLGSGFRDDRMTLEFSRNHDEGAVVSPADGESDVPRRWRNYETPDPLRAFPGAPREVGYPIVFARYGRDARLDTVTATLTGPDGEAIEAYVTQAPEYAAVFLIPKTPLRPLATYEATFTERTRFTKSRFTIGR